MDTIGTPAREAHAAGPAPSRPDRVVKTARLPNGALRREHYDFLGRLQLAEEADGSWLRYRYDAGGALCGAKHSSGASVGFGRAEGELLADTERTQTRIAFDARGFPVRLTLRVDGHEWSVEYRRSSRGRVQALRYPNSTDWLECGMQLRCGERLYVDALGAKAGPPCIRFANGTWAQEEWSPGQPPTLERIAHFDALGEAFVDQGYEYEGSGRVARAGGQCFGYDDAGRLIRCDERGYAFDAAGRLVRAADEVFAYDDTPAVRDAHGVRFEYDALGRRTAAIGARGATRYSYNLFGQLETVELPAGDVVRYLYDGFGRLVGRESGEHRVYYVVDFEGRRLAQCDASGQVTRSYLWFGPQCVGMIDGPCGGMLSATFHRVHGATLAAIGDIRGCMRSVPHADPYGADAPILDGIPGYAGLFGDPDTGLLYAASRWLDPTVGQFISPDSWHGTHALEHLPRGLRSVFDRLPGGTGRPVDAQLAYSWCGYDPVNYCDPNGHNFMGLIWSIISAFLWEMQVTSIALQMEVVNLALWLLFTFPGFMFLWGNDFWKKTSPFNAIPPLLGSYRLMVPFAFPFNSLWNASGAVFTMGNVIWARGEQLETLETTAQRDLLIASNAATYQVSVEAVAADSFRVRSPHAKGTATATAAGTQLTGVAVTTPPPPATVADTFEVLDWISIRLPGGTGDEIRQVNSIAGGSFDLNAALPAGMQGQAVEITRLDLSIVKIQKDDSIIARSVAFARGQALHFQNQIPEGFPTAALAVTEYMLSAKRRASLADSQREAFLVRLAAAADQALFAANDFLRIRAGARYFARLAARRRGTRDLILDSALPNPAQPTDYAKVEVVKLDAGAQAAGQPATGDRVDAGNLNDLRKHDGLAVENTGAATPTTERRIVTQLFVRCAVAALPNALHAVPIAVDLLAPDNSVKADGTVSANNQVTTTAGQAGRFNAGQPVRVRKAPATDFFTTVAAVDNGANRLTFDDAPPAADFPNTTAVAVTLMVGSKRFDADPAAAPGDQVLVKVEQPGSPAQNDVIRVRKAADVQGGAVRKITAAPTVVAQVDSALPGTHAANLTVRRFAPVANTLRDNAAAPLVQIRFTIQGAANPYVQNDELHLRGDEEAWGKVLANPTGQDIFVVDPVEFALRTSNIEVEHITITNRSTADAKLEESLIMIPSDPGEDPITRRRAVESHEMRHVWQYAVLGPFFFSFPLPWLINLGFSFSDNANTASKWIRHFSVGAVDSLFAVIAWGIGTGGRGATSLAGEVTDAARRVITFPADTGADKLAELTAGSPCDVIKGDYDTFNVIEEINAGEKKITLRFALEADKFAVNDRVQVSVSPFEKIRGEVNKWFSLNLERLWSDHIPQAWGRALSKFLNRDSWFPLLGLYPIGFMMAGGDQRRMHFEQDASYHSGDLYTDIAVSNPKEIFVGQFSRLMGYIQGRGFGDTATGLAKKNPLNVLTVELPAGVTADAVAGAVSAGAGRVRFRENYYIPLQDKVENAIGTFFATSKPGDYALHVPDELTNDVVRTITFDADFLELRKIKVKPLTVTPAASAASPLFETESVRFQIQGDPSAEYRLRYKGAPPAPAGTIDGLRFTAPALGAPGPVTHTLEITATYAADNPVFRGAGQKGDARLTPEQRTNLCQELEVHIAALTAPAIGPVQAGRSQQFPMPIAPASVRVTSALPAGAAVNASVVNGTGRPAQLTFIAPDAVTAATNVTFEMVFGSGAVTKTVPATVQVTP